MSATTTVLFKVGDVYTVNINETAGVVVNQGGTSSAKTYSILQVLFTKAVEYHKTELDPTCIITVVGQDIPNLKRGALRQALEIVSNSEVLKNCIASYNKTDRVFTFHNGAVIEFNSYQTEQDAKSGKRDYLFVNEANGILYEIYWQLARRTKHQVFIDYNPNEEFWVHEKLIGKKGVKLIISDHRHNPFLTQKQHDDIENIDDPELWRVYARGYTGKIEGLVFRNWHVSPEIPIDAKLIGYGLDFGFTNDPTTLIAVYMADGELYLTELIYQRGLHVNEIVELMTEYGVKKSDSIIADSAAPQTISELKRLGWYVDGANKGADSIKNGIDILKRYSVNITTQSINLRKEANSYKWKVDPKTSKPLNVPVDFMNHAIDAVRYVALNLLTEAGHKLKAGKFGFRKKKK